MTEKEMLLAYDELCADVLQVEKERIEKTIPGSPADDLQKGLTVLMSPLIRRPTLMFIGINPGSGYYRSHNVKRINTAPADMNEYVAAGEEGWDYNLAKQTRSVISQTQLAKDMEHSVKTNYYYTATTDQRELETFVKLVKQETGIDYWLQGLEWPRRLVEMVAPKVIICEGKLAFYLVSQIYGREKDDLFPHFSTGSTHIVGYRRSPSICDQDELIDLLNNLDMASVS